MAKNEYSEQQKADAVKRAEEIGVQAAAKELGIPLKLLRTYMLLSPANKSLFIKHDVQGDPCLLPPHNQKNHFSLLSQL